MSSRSVRSENKRPTRMSSEQLDAVFSAVSHPARRQVLVSLHARGGAMTAGEIADRFKHSWPTTTRHLGVLEDALLLDVQKQGRKRLYSLRSAGLVQASNWLIDVAARPETPTDKERPDWTKLSYGTMRNAIPPKE